MGQGAAHIEERAYVRVKVDMCCLITANPPTRPLWADAGGCSASLQPFAAGVGDSTGAALHSSRCTQLDEAIAPNELLSAPRILEPSSWSAALPRRPLSLLSSLQAMADQPPDSSLLAHAKLPPHRPRRPGANAPPLTFLCPNPSTPAPCVLTVLSVPLAFALSNPPPLDCACPSQLWASAGRGAVVMVMVMIRLGWVRKPQQCPHSPSAWASAAEEGLTSEPRGLAGCPPWLARGATWA